MRVLVSLFLNLFCGSRMWKGVNTDPALIREQTVGNTCAKDRGLQATDAPPLGPIGGGRWWVFMPPVKGLQGQHSQECMAEGNRQPFHRKPAIILQNNNHKSKQVSKNKYVKSHRQARNDEAGQDGWSATNTTGRWFRSCRRSSPLNNP